MHNQKNDSDLSVDKLPHTNPTVDIAKSHVASLGSILRHRKLALSLACAALLAIVALVVWVIHDIRETRRLDATSVVLSDDLTAEFGATTKASDFIWHLDGSIVDDVAIDTSQLGAVEVEFQYHNIKNKKRTKKFTVNIVDTTQPIIYGQKNYTINVGYDGDLTNLMLSGDNVDDHPTRKINGQYDLQKPGDYALEYTITDASSNTASHPFTLHVIKPAENITNQNQNNSGTSTYVGTPISNVIQQYKNGNTAIGIDVSSWQGEIDWEKVRSAGVEFAIIRVGYQADYGGEYTLDTTFQDNLSGAIAAGIPVGVYYYSCANNIDEARRQAEWVLAQIENYPLELGVTFDWEEWSDFNRAGISFHTLQKIADTFIETVKKAGYDGMLYGSKNYLDKFWQHNTHPVWLAQYYDHPTYSRSFSIWQLTDTGTVPGINGYVDLDVRYSP